MDTWLYANIFMNSFWYKGLQIHKEIAVLLWFFYTGSLEAVDYIDRIFLC